MDKKTFQLPSPGPFGSRRLRGARSSLRLTDDAALALGISLDANHASPAAIGDALFTRPALSGTSGRAHIQTIKR